MGTGEGAAAGEAEPLMVPAPSLGFDDGRRRRRL